MAKQNIFVKYIPSSNPEKNLVQPISVGLAEKNSLEKPDLILMYSLRPGGAALDQKNEFVGKIGFS